MFGKTLKTRILKTNDYLSVVLYSFAFFGLANFNKAQADYNETLHMKWAKSYGAQEADLFASITQTYDGGFAVCGETASSTLSNEGSTDAFIAKYDKDGNQIWIKFWGGSKEDSYRVIKESPDKSLIVVGNSNSKNTSLSNRGSTDGIVAKYDEDGNQVWIKNFGGSGGENIKSMDITSSGEILVGMHSGSQDLSVSSNGGYDIYLIKLDKNGNEIWMRGFGGSDTEYVNGVVSLSNQNIVLVGHTYSEDFTNSATSDGGDAIVIMLDNSGKLLWMRYFGGSANDYFTSALEATNGDIIVIGASPSTDCNFENIGKLDGIIARYDKEGNQLWLKNFGGSLNDYPWSIKKSPAGGYYCLGYTYSDSFEKESKATTSNAFIIRFDENGNEMWLETFGGSGEDRFLSAIVNSDGDIIAVGYCGSSDLEITNNGETDALIVKYSIEYTLAPDNTYINSSLYLKPENTLNMSIDTNYILFDDFSISEDVEKPNAATFGVTSSLPYELKLFLVSDIKGQAYGDVLDSPVLQVKLNLEDNYKDFSKTDKCITLAQNQEPTSKTYHSVDIKVLGSKIVKSDVYKATLKFVINQM